MTVPVVTELAQQYPEWHITLLTRRSFLPLFDFAPSNVEVLGINLKEYGGLLGLGRLYALLKKRKFDVVADFHDVLRSKFLRTMFKWSGIRVAVIDKGRAEKKALLGHGRDAEPLKPVMERYRDVLRALDFDVRPTFTRLFQPHEVDFAEVEQRVGKKAEGERWVGIAPLAAHPGKVYSTDSLQLVANRLADEGIRVFAFGAGASERNVLSLWEKENVTSVCGKMGGLHNELLLMSQLDCMVAMDSSNMHMASLCGTPVVSIWGATHPKMGFAPFGQPADLALQDDTLPCRPCSVYGNQPCKLKDYRCLRGITPTRIFDKVMEVLQSSAR